LPETNGTSIDNRDTEKAERKRTRERERGKEK